MMNVLGVEFDSLLKWDHQVAQAINKAKRALHGIRLIKKHFTKTELRQLLTSNFYSILYYNSEVWHIPTLHSNLKRMLLGASASALRLIGQSRDIRISYDRLHRMNARATPY